MHTALASIPSTEAEHQEFKATLAIQSDRVSSRAAWATSDPIALFNLRIYENLNIGTKNSKAEEATFF